MGNSNTRKSKDDIAIPHAEEIEKLYHSLCDYGLMSPEKFKDHFCRPSEALAQNLFNRFFIDLISASRETVEMFIQRAHAILETAYLPTIEQSAFYFDLICHSSEDPDESVIKELVKVAYQYGMISSELPTENYSFKNIEKDLAINGVVNSFLNGQPSIEKEFFIQQSSKLNLFGGFQIWLHYKMTSKILKTSFEMLPLPYECTTKKKMLSPTLFWLLCSILPSCYLKLENKYKLKDEDIENEEDDDEKKFTWNLLYESNEHGLSLNRFKNKVIGYKSPTVFVIETSGNHLLVLVVDQPWVDTADKFGDAYCQLIEIHPKMNIIEENSNMVYLKETSRSLPTGLIIGSGARPKVKILPDLSTANLIYKGRENDTVEKIEVWGCGGVEAINSQSDLKKWERNEVEKRKKVKLPGQWDTDKAILEMGGVTVNHSQRGDV